MASNERENARRRRERIPGAVMDNLEDMIAILLDETGPDLAAIHEWIAQREQVARREFDHRELGDLLRLSRLMLHLQDAMSRVERKARDARSGEYRNRKPEENE